LPGMVHVRDRRFAKALQRAAGWIGTISPPGEYVYSEFDDINIWDAGQAAFMRSWVSGYGHLAERAAQDHRGIGVAMLPAGASGRWNTLGGSGIAVSKFGNNRELAIKLAIEMTDRAHEMTKLRAVSGIATHAHLSPDRTVGGGNTINVISSEIMEHLIVRPAQAAGEHYDQVSRDYHSAVNAVLRRKLEPEAALMELEEKLVKTTGFRAWHGDVSASRPMLISHPGPTLQ
jgi:trehalose/maltose transport system substrate-binding protein